MSYPFRGFNIYGPNPFNPNYDPTGIHNYDVYDVAEVVGSLHADIIRVPFNWDGYQPQEQIIQEGQINDIKALVTRGRVTNPNLMALIEVDWIPEWVPGRVPLSPLDNRSHYVATPAGYSAYGQMCQNVLQNLAGYANFIELSNEPNGIYDDDGTDIPAVHYGAMCAYAAYWIDFCLGPPKFPVIGAIQPNYSWKTYLGAMMNEFYRLCQEFYPWASKPFDLLRLIKSARISYHAYWDHGETSSSVALNHVENSVEWLHSSYPDHRIWITETGASSETMSPYGQANFVLGMCYQVCGPRSRVEALLFWPATDAEGHAWDPERPFYRFGVIEEDGSTLKPSGFSVQTAFGDAYWT